MQGEKGEIGPEGVPGQRGLPGKNVSKLLKCHLYRESNSTNITKKINTLQRIDPQGQPGIDGPPGPPVSYQNFTGSQENLYYYNHSLTGPTRSGWTKG